MKINCSECNLDLGEIRDATMRKGVAHLCNRCESLRKTPVKQQYYQKPEDPYDLFKKYMDK